LIDRKEEIMKIATMLFSEGGYDNTSTRELAKAVELSVAGLYYFFHNKEEILFNILDSCMAKLLGNVESGIKKDDDPQTNIARVIEHMVIDVVEQKMQIGLLIKESNRLNPEQLEIINNKKRDMVKLIKNEISRINDQDRLKHFNLTFLTFALIAIVNWAYRWFDPNGPLTAKEFALETTNLFFYGVLKQ
jgi:AcrR family transcriptional regulator